MNCHEAAEFVSALADGEKIPSDIAEHIGFCEVCRTQLAEYAYMGAELRRTAILESLEPPTVAWEQQKSGSSRFLLKGWGTMRIPRFAFALMLVVIVALGSGLAVLRARPISAGRVLMLTLKPNGEKSVHCPMLVGNDKASPCVVMQGVKSGMIGLSFQITSVAPDHIELSARSYFAARPASEGNSYGMSMSVEELENSAQERYWVKPGQDLEMRIAGFGPVVLGSQLMDRLPASETSSSCSGN